MLKFLIDVNLPYYFSVWKNDEYIHLKDIDETWSDKKVWEYAKENNLTIISKDADFSNRIILAEPPPKIIHIKIGNMKLKDFRVFLNSIWKDVLEMNSKYKLVNVYLDEIEAIN